MKRREFIHIGMGAAAALAAGDIPAIAAGKPGKAGRRPKILVIGIDGLDPHLTQVWMKQGRLPALQKLVASGGIRRLGTSLPPQSPVAWSDFIAGMGPGGHGIYDFIHRDPQTYMPIFSATETQGGGRTFRLGKYVFPLSGGQVVNMRDGRAFWQVLEDHGVPAVIVRMPSNYPPVPTRQRTFSGMGTPDIKGSYGIFNYYTNAYRELDREAGGGGRVHEVYVIGNRVEASLPGPVNTFLKDAPEARADFRVFIDRDHPVAKIAVQGQEFILKEKEWSGWIRVNFDLIPTQSVSGICRFYLKELRPKFKLYVSPVHIDPARPALPLSTPASYARELSDQFGSFFTKGLPADTSALENGVLDETEFLEQDEDILKESLDLFEYELNRFDEGLFFYYFSNADQRQHMFWRFLDRNHPSYDPDLAERYRDVIADTYVQMDRAVDTAMRKADKDTVVMVMSDHGFNPFRRGFNLNTWLLESGYHRLTDPRKRAETSLFMDTDWSRTQAYGVGLNSLYINERGREREGTVAPGAEKDRLIRELADRLESIVDPATGERPILRAYVSRDVYTGKHLDSAPDIVVGFNQGYRIAWESPLGGFPEEVLTDNREKWSGDHMSSPEVIPGVLAMNRPIPAEFPKLKDVTVSILDLYGIGPEEDMTGRSVFNKE